tara:strand:+ start:235 stop:696 length:462 start_codon:yes stop_codon:yes gene_type:complete
MSSFIVNSKHIAEITKHFVSLPHVSKTFYNTHKKQEIKIKEGLPFKTVLGVMLGHGNLKGVNDRYPKHIDVEADAEFLTEIGKETLKPKDYKLSYAELINMCQCLNYQSMDAINYDVSDTSFIIEKIKDSFASRWADVETDGDENKIRWSYPN